MYQPAGLKIEETSYKNVYLVKKADGLCQNIPVEVGDQLLKLQGKDVSQYKGGLKQLKTIIKKEKRIEMVVRRGPIEVDSDDDDSSYHDEDGGGEEQEEEGDDDEDEEEEDGDESGDDYNDVDDDDDDEEQDEQYDDYEIKPGSDMLLNNIDSKRKLNGQQVQILSQSKRDLSYECQLPDGSRINVTQDHLQPIEEDKVDVSLRYIPNSERSMMTNLIEPGDIMKIRGLKKHAKMNGTMVEILLPAKQPGRWECALCSDRDRVIAVLSENLRHVM